MNEKKGILIGIVIVGSVILSIAIYLLNIRNIGIRNVAEVCIVFLLIAFATYILWDKLKNAQKGLPTKDERVTTINYKAGYYGFIAAIWSAVLSSLIGDILLKRDLNNADVTALVVIISGLVFFVSYFYLYRKGIKETETGV